MKVLKFGGSSVRDAAHIRKTVSIFTSESNVRAVICSAMKGVTDELIRAALQAETGDKAYLSTLESVWQRKKEAVDALFTGEMQTGKKVITHLESEYTELKEICHGVFLLKECSARSLDFIMSFGERMNSQLIRDYAAFLKHEVFYVDARELVFTDGSHGNASVDMSKTRTGIKKYFSKRRGTGIVTGFIASGPAGITTTLGRNGSDYSASIFGAALGASSIEIWTDVDGVLEADPAVVPQAGVIDELSVDEAMELSYFGAEVLHPSTMIPAIESNIPVWIKNTLNPTAAGTKISTDAGTNPNIITGIASVPEVTLINVIGSGMVGSRGTAMKIFAALSKVGVNIIMISQASSEHSICVVIRSQESASALHGLRTELEYELRTGAIQDIAVLDDLEIVAIIGANMRGRPGVSGKLFKTLGDEGVNILAIAQGSSEMNISFVIAREDHARSLQSIHRAFFEEGT